MKHEKMKKGIRAVRELAMSKDESFAILQNLAKYVENNPLPEEAPVASPFYSSYFNSITLRPRFVYATFSFVSLFFVGSSVIFAASASIPGDILYPVKTNIVEPVEDVLAVTPVAKAKLAAERTENTLKIAEQLIKNNTLNEETRTVLEQDFKRHTNAFNAFAQKAKDTDSQNISDTRIKLENTVEEHSNILNEMKNSDSGDQKDNIEKFSTVVIKNLLSENKNDTHNEAEKQKRENGRNEKRRIVPSSIDSDENTSQGATSTTRDNDHKNTKNTDENHNNTLNGTSSSNTQTEDNSHETETTRLKTFREVEHNDTQTTNSSSSSSNTREESKSEKEHEGDRDDR